METPVQTAARLLTTLGELTEREGMYLSGGYYDMAVEIRQRAEPLVHQLVHLADQPGVPELHPQVAAVLEHSARNAAVLRGKLAELDIQIRQNDQARHRAAHLAPAYAPAPGPAPSRFQAAG